MSMKKIENKATVVKGFKVFNPDWTCKEKQYTCPGKFEEDVEISLCGHGMHFCKKAVDCFRYYSFNPKNKVAEVVAYGSIVEDDNKCCTNKLEIIREIPWVELLEIVNTGENCTGFRNSGNCNSGGYNSGNYNSGDCNSGDYNSGDCNSGDYNSGNYNSGNCNSGDYNSGNCNSGDYNSGRWNKTNFSNGCFNTAEPKIYLFNKPSEWTYRDWFNSDACHLLNHLSDSLFKYILFNDMTDEEIAAHPEAVTTGCYLKELDKAECAANWWRSLNQYQKNAIMSIPNFDKEIFKEITGVEVG